MSCTPGALLPPDIVRTGAGALYSSKARASGHSKHILSASLGAPSRRDRFRRPSRRRPPQPLIPLMGLSFVAILLDGVLQKVLGAQEVDLVFGRLGLQQEADLSAVARSTHHCTAVHGARGGEGPALEGSIPRMLQDKPQNGRSEAQSTQACSRRYMRQLTDGIGCSRSPFCRKCCSPLIASGCFDEAH